MSLPLWSKHDAEMYRSLSLFPEKLEGAYLNVDDFRSHFRDLYGRPVQDIVEALTLYGREGYFKHEIVLAPDYLKYGNAISQIDGALSVLRPAPSSPHTGYHALSESVHGKVMAERPLTKVEVTSLPDEVKPYLTFRLSDIDRTRLREELAIYNDNAFIQPSRLVKSTHAEPAPRLSPLDLTKLSLRPENYDKYNGVLHLTPFVDRKIAGKTGVKRPGGKAYEQCWIMERLFKSEKSLKHGVEISSILGVSRNTVDKTTTKKIENAKTEINRKVADRSGPKNLIKIQNGKVFLNNSYL